MAILLTNEDLKTLITPELAIEVMEETYRSITEGHAVTRTRSQTFAPTSQHDVVLEFRTMDGAVPFFGAMALRVLPDLRRYPKIGENWRVEKIPQRNGRFLAFDLIFDLNTGDLEAIVHDAYLQKMRMLGAHAAAAKYLARSNSENVGILGSGFLADALLLGLTRIFPLSNFKVFSPTSEHRERFAKRVQDTLGLKGVSVSCPEVAVRDVDIVLVATNSLQPVYFEKWLTPGLHLSAISAYGTDDACFTRSDNTVLSMREGRCNEGLNFYPRTLTDSIAPRLKSFGRTVQWDDYPELGEVIVGKSPGRRTPEEITFFCNNIGFGAQFAALGGKAVALAKERGIGAALATDDWYEDTR